MIKIIILNHLDQCVEVVPVSDEDYERYGGKDGFFPQNYLSNHGYNWDNRSFMVCEEDCHVFWANETIPYANL